ncbi:putative glucan endo-1,3-beta-D-glucosidase [Dioscorea sansibarensis]
MTTLSAKILPLLFYLLLLCLLITTRTDAANEEKHWCVADEQTPDDVLQKALDWACGFGGADCRMIQKNKECFLPNTLKDHASYAFNSYWQKYKHQGGSCYFDAAAMVTDLDPSHGSCKYETLP